MKKFILALTVLALAAGCAPAAPRGKTLVAVFSKTGEQYHVGVIQEGNTMIVAKMIAAATGADLFEIRAANAYPEGYDETTDIARKELRAGVRPELAEDKDIGAYDTVFLGYPIWWGEMPMAVFTFLESHDWKGKTVVPFATHEGSGIGRTQESLQKALPDAKILGGLAVRGAVAQNERPQAQQAVTEWLAKLGL